MNKEAIQQYLDARKAVRGGKDPQAFMRLGEIYAKGIGTTSNHVLANYFYDKAARLGCEEVYDFITLEYENGDRSIAKDIDKAIEAKGAYTQNIINGIKKTIEAERVKRNFGLLSRARQHIYSLYPDYNEEDAITDILGGKDSINADLYYAMCTSDNMSEINIDLQDEVLRQLYAPISQNRALLKNINESRDVNLLGNEVGEILQCIANYTDAYYKISRKYKIKKQKLSNIESLELFPYLKASLLPKIRMEALRGLLSLREIDSHIDDYLNCLDCDEDLLNASEKIENRDIQMYLISFVELNLDIEALESIYRSLQLSYQQKDYQPLAEYMNNFTSRLSRQGIEHDLPEFTAEILNTLLS